jgi:iron(III) transport system permease protein
VGGNSRAVAAFAVLTAIIVASPVISIALLATQPAPELWQHLIDYVLPLAVRDTALLLGGDGAADRRRNRVADLAA